MHLEPSFEMTNIAIGQFDFDDGGNYCGGSEGGKAHGHGICMGPGGQGEYAGAWQFGFEISGVYTWPNGNDYAGQWMQGKRHGLGVERRGHWVYRGEWTQGFMGRYGVRQSTVSEARYEGTWTSGLHDGYGLETYSDGGTYQGQWMKGVRHGYGVRKSAIYSKAALCRSTKVRRSSLTSVRSETETTTPLPEHHPAHHHHHLGLTGGEGTGHSAVSGFNSDPDAPHIGFFVKGKEKAIVRRGSFLSRYSPALGPGNNMKRQRSAELLMSGSNSRQHRAIPSVAALTTTADGETIDDLTVETYTGEWKNDKRSGFGVCERSDGLKYEGEWEDNCKNGFGVTTFADGTKEDGKYKNNVLLSTGKKILLLRAAKLREQIDAAVASAQRSAQIATQKSDIANSRMESSRSKAELSLEFVRKAQNDSERAKQQTKNNSEQNQMNSGSSKILKRLSIPRHNMFDRQQQQQQQQQQQLNTVISQNQIQNNYNQQKSATPLRQSSRPYDDQQTNDVRRPYDDQQTNDVRQNDNNYVTQQRHQLSSVAERNNENLTSVGDWTDQTGQTQLTNRITPRRSTNDEPDYSQMNHVDTSITALYNRVPSSSSAAVNERRLSAQIASNHQSQLRRSEERIPLDGGQSISPDRRQYSREFSDVDNMVENIFSYLDEEEEQIVSEVGTGSLPVLQETSEGGEGASSTLFSQPSLRNRRDVRCPNLLIFNRNKDAKEREPLPLRRRLTLPSIVKYGTGGPVVGRGTGVFVSTEAAAKNINILENVRVPEAVETIVIDNGVRKRLEEELEYRPPPLPPDIDPVEEVLEPPRELRRRYKLESLSLTKKSDMGSLPDVSVCRQMEEKAIGLPRKEMEMLIRQRRQEMEELRQLENQLRKRAIVLKIGDFKDWCGRHQLALFLIVVNLVLVATFYKLLSE